MQNKRKNKQGLLILLTLITIMACLFFMEIVLRLYKAKSNEIAGEMNPEFHHSYKVNDKGYRYPSPEDEFKKIYIKTNELGMRGEAIPDKKTGKRILILGDSFIQADEVAFKKTVGQILQSRLGQDKYLVMQQGYSSWSPLLELNFLIKTFNKIQPDHVFLVLCVNDFYDPDVYPSSDSAYTKETIFDAEGWPVRFNVSRQTLAGPKPKPPRSYLLDSLGGIIKRVKSWHKNGCEKNGCEKTITQKNINFLFNLGKDYTKIKALEKLNNLKFLENMIRLGRSWQDWDEETLANTEISLAYIKKMAKFLEEKNASLTIMLAPIGWNISPDEISIGKKAADYYRLDDKVVFPDKGLRDKLKEFSAKHNINYLEIEEAIKDFKIQHPNIRLYLRSDGHWDENGHKLVADILYNFIQPNFTTEEINPNKVYTAEETCNFLEMSKNTIKRWLKSLRGNY